MDRISTSRAASGTATVTALRQADLLVVTAPYVTADGLLSEGKAFSISNDAAREMEGIAAVQENYHVFLLKSGHLVEYAVLDRRIGASKPILFFKPDGGRVEIRLTEFDRDLRPVEILAPDSAP